MTDLFLGDLSLMGDGLFRLEALGTDSGTDWGNPQPIETQLNSFLQYGALVASEGWENRTVMVAVSVVGSDGVERADAEQALAGEVGKRNVLIYTPPGTEIPTRYEVLASSFDQVPNDLLEVMSGEKIYMLRLVCLPFGFSAAESVVAAIGTPPVTPTTSNVDDGSSATNWSASFNGATVAATSTTITGRTVVGASTPGFTLIPTTTQLALSRSGSIATSVTKFLIIDWAYLGGQPTSDGLVVGWNGVYLTKVSEGASPIAGDVRSVFMVDPATASLGGLSIYLTTTGTLSGSSNRSLYVDNIDRTDTPLAVSGKQQLRTFTVSGSAPTTGSISVQHETNALGDGVMVYTFPASDASSVAYNPQCSPLRVSGPSQNPDSTAVSGRNVNLDATEFYSIPAFALPNGEYMVWARMKSASANPSVAWTVTPQLPVGTQIGTTQAYSTAVALGGSVYKSVCLGTVHLPTLDTGLVGATLVGIGAASPSTDDVFLDEVWLYNLTIGDLTVLSVGSGSPSPGGPSKRLWIDSPSTDNEGLGGLFRGHSSDRSDSFSAYPNAAAVGVHQLIPGTNKVFTVTPNADAAQSSYRSRAAWVHTAAS